MKKLLSIFLIVILTLTALPMTAQAAQASQYAKTISVTLQVKSGEDISEAFNAASYQVKNEKNTLLKIYIPKGKYTSTDQLRVWSNTEVYFNGATITHKGENSTMMRMGLEYEWEAANGGKGYTGYTGGKHIKLVGGTMNGGGLNQACVRFGHMKDLTFTDMVFTNVKNSHHVELGACANIVFDGCTFSNFVGDWGSHSNHEALQFDATVGDGGNRYHFGGYPATQDDTPCKNVTVKNCTFKNLQRGMGSHAGSANTYFNNMRFINNTFTNITGYAIIASAYTNSVIAGNTITNCAAGIFFRALEGSHGNFYAAQTHSSKRTKYKDFSSTIKNNIITVTRGYKKAYDNTGYGIHLYGEKLAKKDYNSPAGDWRLSNVTVQGNKITMNATGYGIWVEGVVKSVIKKNAVTCNLTQQGAGGNGDGIRMDRCVSNKVYNNTVVNKTAKGGYDSDMSGINLMNSSYNTLYQNTVKKVKKDGIKMDASAHNTVKENTVVTAGRDIVHATASSRNTFTANTFSASERDGFNTDASSYNTYQGNTLKKIGRRGFNLYGGKANLIKQNTVKQCGEDAVHIDSTDATNIYSNAFSTLGRDGVNMNECKNSWIWDTDIYYPKRDGIHMTGGASNWATENTFNYCTRDCVNLDSASKCKFESNRIKNTTRRAFNFYGGTSNRILSNTVTDSGEDGVCADGSSKLTVDGNSFKTQGRDGIKLDNSSKTVITNNTIKASTRYGINATAAQIKTDSGNAISGSGKKNRSWK